MNSLQAFTWGYHGWGSASRHFVRAVDTLERRRVSPAGVCGFADLPQDACA
ncbi:MAG: hypothetical protein JSR66_01290 [Proteobacteria bacterium]|nr:hypothetical protein [Pseudomonadota bacterium]